MCVYNLAGNSLKDTWGVGLLWSIELVAVLLSYATVAIAYDSSCYDFLWAVAGWSHRDLKIRWAGGPAKLSNGHENMHKREPQPPRRGAPTLTQAAGSLEQCNTPSFLIKLLFKSVSMGFLQKRNPSFFVSLQFCA